jgi:hypothetical protein
MPIRTDETPRRTYTRDPQPPEVGHVDEADFETEVSESVGKDDSPFDDNLNPIDKDPINTHGSER